jgi:predicted ABC-type sugar transport system permease subunit
VEHVAWECAEVVLAAGQRRVRVSIQCDLSVGELMELVWCMLAMCSSGNRWKKLKNPNLGTTRLRFRLLLDQAWLFICAGRLTILFCSAS